MTRVRLDEARPAGRGRLTPAGSVQDVELAARLAGYKRIIAGRYNSVAPEEIDERLSPGTLHVSTKIDGELWFLVLEDGEATLVAHNGRALLGEVPVLGEIRSLVAPRAVGLTIVAGELFAVGKGSRPRVGDVAQALSGDEAAQVARLGFHAFDLLDGGDAARPGPPEKYGERYAVLERLFAGGKRAKAVRTEQVSGPAEVKRLFAEWVEGGKAEGLVVRSEADGRISKVKPIFNLDAAVVGFTERTDAPRQIRSMLLAVLRDEGQFQVVGSVGNLGTDELRAELYERLEPALCPSRFRSASRSGALYRFVRPELVVEVRVTDLQVDDSNGRAIPRMVLEHDAETGWHPVRSMSGVSLIHPVLVRVRDDKRVDAVDVRASQVLERAEVPNLETHVEALALPKSELVVRRVWTKTTKGKTAVRKLLTWKTHKEGLSAEWPAWVVHWTDYSPGRAAPLQREVRPAPDAEEAARIAEAMIDKGVKKGWDEVPAGG